MQTPIRPRAARLGNYRRIDGPHHPLRCRPQPLPRSSQLLRQPQQPGFARPQSLKQSHRTQLRQPPPRAPAPRSPPASIPVPDASAGPAVKQPHPALRESVSGLPSYALVLPILAAGTAAVPPNSPTPQGRCPCRKHNLRRVTLATIKLTLMPRGGTRDSISNLHRGLRTGGANRWRGTP